MIKKEDCFLIGEFVKTHGLQGDLVLSVENDFPEEYEEGSIFVDIDGGLVPFFISPDGLRTRNHSTYIIKLDGVESEDKASRLIKCPVYLDKSLFTEEDNLSLNILEGFTLYGEKEGEVGKIVRIDDFSGNIVLTVEYNSNEVMIPLIEERVTELNYDTNKIVIDLPEGILDL